MTQAVVELQSVDFVTADWINESGVSEFIATRNATEIKNVGRIKDKLRNPEYNHVGGWICESLNLETGKSGGYGQFKPYTVWNRLDKDPAKYITYPAGKPWDCIFLRIDQKTWDKIAARYGVEIKDSDIDTIRYDRGFWLWVLKHPELPIILTEGAKKAGALLSNGYIAICLPGVWGWKVKDVEEFVPAMVKFTEQPRKFILCFDADIVEKYQVYDALKRCGQKLTATGATVTVLRWEKEQGKGCDDFILKNGIPKWEEVVENEWTFESYIDQLEKIYGAPPASKPKAVKKEKDKEARGERSRFLEVLACVKQAYAGRVRMSDYGDVVYMDSEPLAKAADFFNRTYQMCCEVLGYDPTDKHVERALDIFFEDNRFNPVVEYLLSVKDRQNKGAIERLAVEGMGIASQFQRLLLRKQLIACVARAVEPGCKVDSVAVIW